MAASSQSKRAGQNGKMRMAIQPVILCGGAGTRLWPLSRKSFPKQFVPLIGGKSLLQLTLERVAGLADPTVGVVCVGSEEHRFLISEAMDTAGIKGTIVLEPAARNTAAAMALAALQAPAPDQSCCSARPTTTSRTLPPSAQWCKGVQRRLGKALSSPSE